MPPFTYEPYRNPHVGSLSQLLMAPGQIEAQRAQTVGNAQAQAAQASGQAWGNAIQGAGQAVSGAIQQATDPRRKLEAAQLESAMLENDAAKQRKADLIALDQAMSTPGGLDAVLKAAPGHLQPAILKSYQEAQRIGNDAKASAQKARELQQEHFGYLGAQIKQNAYDPTWALAAIHQARETYADDPALLKQIDALRMQVIEQPESIQKIADAAILGSSYKTLLTPQAPIEHDPTKALVTREGKTIVAAVPKVEEPKTYKVTVAGPKGEKLEKLVTEAELKAGVPAYQEPDMARADRYLWSMAPDGTVKLMTPQEVRQTGSAQPPTADMRNKAAGRELVAKSISAVQDLSQRIITKVGPTQRAEALKRGADAVFGNDAEFRTYQDARMGLAGNLAVAQQGSRPSDADIKAIWLPLVPDPYRDTADSAALKWDLIRTMSNAPPSEGGGAPLPAGVTSFSTAPITRKPVTRGR